ncbi:MAG TPA: hypothetical protein DEB31_04445 [Clostridiales bacterium]|nr:hypothetical protein [Clostridiales bacterium]
MSNEYEIIKYPYFNYFNLFLVAIDYRTPHLHRDFEIDLVLDGEPVFLVNGVSHALNPGDIILLNPDQLHEIQTVKKSATILALQVSPKIFINAVPSIQSLFFDEMFLRTSLSLKQLKNVRNSLLQLALVYMEKSPYYELECMSILSGMMYLFLCELPVHSITPELQAEANKRADRLRRIIDFVDENYTRKTRLKDVAKLEGLSLNYLSYFIKENLNMTFQDYICSLRLNQAKKLLLSSDKSLFTICIESGFSDPRYLFKAFTTNVGITPGEFRKQTSQLVDENGRIHRSSHSSERYFSTEMALNLVQSARNADIV